MVGTGRRVEYTPLARLWEQRSRSLVCVYTLALSAFGIVVLSVLTQASLAASGTCASTTIDSDGNLHLFGS